MGFNSMAYSVDEMKQALFNADNNGDFDAANAIAAEIKSFQQNDILSKWDQAQGVDTPEAIAAAAPHQTTAPTFKEQAIGIGEAGLTLATGATTGMIGGMGGAIKGAYDEFQSGEFGSPEAAQRISQASMEGAQAGTKMPSTEQGMEMLQGIEKATAFMGALPPIMAESAAISAAVRNATSYAPVVAAGVQKAGQATRSATSNTIQALEKFGVDADGVPLMQQDRKPPAFPIDGGGMSVGAAKNPMTQIRLDKANGLMVPVRLSKGDATRDEDQMKFEWETAKIEGGEPLRQRKRENQQELQGNFDAMIDYIDAKITNDDPQLGANVKTALKDDFDFYTRRMNYQYAYARRSNALSEPVEMDNLANFMNQNRDQRLESGIMERLQSKLEVMESATGDFMDGTLAISKKMNVEQAEELIQYINKNVDQSDDRDRVMGGMMKGVVDEITAEVSNAEYQKARQTRVDRAQKFEEKRIIIDLLSKKKGVQDQVVAVEDVLKKVVLSPTAKRDSLLEFKKTILTSNEEGIQAWKDIQGSTLAYIQKKATTQTTDGNSDPMISAAALKRILEPLESSGKLSILFDKKIQNNIELLKDVADYVLTAPPGVINSSNTASTMAMMADMLLIGVGTVPAATITKFAVQKVKDKNLQKRILDALKSQERKD